jgi:hypothetical protein
MAMRDAVHPVFRILILQIEGCNTILDISHLRSFDLRSYPFSTFNLKWIFSQLRKPAELKTAYH